MADVPAWMLIVNTLAVGGFGLLAVCWAMRAPLLVSRDAFLKIAGVAMFNTLAMIVIEKTKDIAILPATYDAGIGPKGRIGFIALANGYTSEHEVDAIIFGTGFKAQDPIPPGTVYGRGGVDMAEA